MTLAGARLGMISTFSHLERIEITIIFGSFLGGKGYDLRNYDLELNLGQKMPFSNYTKWYIHSTFIISSSTTHLFFKLAAPLKLELINKFFFKQNIFNVLSGREGLMSFSSSFNYTLPPSTCEWVILETAVGRTRIRNHHSTWHIVGIMDES